MSASPPDPAAIAPALLDWYDRGARTLPWRAPPGRPPMDPYRVWLSEVMLQQTQVATVIPYFLAFTRRWPDFAALAAADEGDVMAAWAGLGYYSRARNLIACARAVVRDHGGRLPPEEGALLRLPGIGAYTAAAIAAIAFDRRAVVVDGNVERVVARLFALDQLMPGVKGAIRVHADAITPDTRPGDFAQAMMDLGATVCAPRAPQCLICPLRAQCRAAAAGNPQAYPVKAPRKAKPVRHATMYWVERGGHVLLVRRPDKGLLGGMLALPTGPWTDVAPGLTGAPVAAGWAWADSAVRHIFTHFELHCRLATVTLPLHIETDGQWWPIDRLDEAGLPTLFAKVAALMRSG